MAKSNIVRERSIREQTKKKQAKVRFIVEIAIALVLAFIVSEMFFVGYSMQESSMSPTMETGDRFLVNRVAFRVGRIHRGDLIAYRSQDDADSTIHVKRVIALPGETVQIKNGIILIDGKTYMEKKQLPVIKNAGNAAEKMKIGDSEYFVLGDNRNNSEDSRFSDVGAIKSALIIGKPWFITSSGSRFGFLR